MLPDRSVLIGQTLVENAKIVKFKCDILGDFQTLCQRKKSAMCANFSPDGSQIFVLGRKSNPLLYNLANPLPIAEFDHPGYWNRCTMKSGTFSAQDYVFSGSDNFAIYAWKVPDQDQDFQYIKRADFVLQGHQSIVNQVRYNSTFDILASSGVEKRIKLWSPFDIGNVQL